MKKLIALFGVVGMIAALAACTSAEKPVAKSAADLAYELCEVELDADAPLCKDAEVVKPFIDQLLSAKAEAKKVVAMKRERDGG